nr:hypothetical protein [Tanacetum cinerariifolium]
MAISVILVSLDSSEDSVRTPAGRRSPIIPRRRVMILAPGQPIPYGRPYRYHPNGPRVRDIGYLADVEVGPKETRVERVMHHVMPEDTPKPTQEGAVEVTYETLGDLVQRFHDHTQAISVYRIQVIEGVQRE